MINSKPVVCVTSSTNNAVFPEATREIQMTMTYCDAIYSAGGVPVVGPEHGAEELSELCDALLLTGGRDVEPSLYGEDVLNDTIKTDPPRTEFELALIREFMAREKPIMCICRGVQMLNVALGGTLYQDLVEQCGYVHYNKDIRHYVYAEPGSILHELFGEKFKTNSTHHQAIKQLAPGLKATAHSIEGIVEAFEHESLPIFGTQFHPERLSGKYNDGRTPDFTPLFRRFVANAKACAERE